VNPGFHLVRARWIPGFTSSEQGAAPGPPFGVDFQGNQDPHSLLPRGWQRWPGDRFDVIWTFTLVPGSAPAQYTFGQIPQQLLSGDADTVIST
jgi:hypothetical protein